MTDLPATPIGLDDLPAPLRARVEAEMVEGERLLWASVAGPRPDAALMNPIKPVTVGLFFLIISLALWGWSRYVRTHPLGNGDPGFPFTVGCLMAIPAGIAFLVAWGAQAARARNRRPDRRQLYALSDRGIVVWEAEDAARGVEVMSIDPPTVRSVHRLEYPDGSGEVRISFHGEEPEANILPPRHLVGLADVRRVEALTRSVLVASARPGPHESRHRSASDTCEGAR